ncbi:hypothetical protein [Prochlorococcus marinus]|uniref:hypothetical protein n=1 Tax=Prochlorococcus marinus TaxID=1219 RepID=UPI0039B0899A
MNTLLITIFLCISALSSAGFYEARGLITIVDWTIFSKLSIILPLIFSLYLVVKSKILNNKFFLNLLGIAILGFLINLINSYSVNETPIYFSTFSVFGYSIGAYACINQNFNSSIRNALLIFSLLNLIVAISQIMVGYFGFPLETLIYGLGLRDGGSFSAFRNLGRATGLFNTPFSLASLGSLLMALPLYKSRIRMNVLLGYLLVLVSLSRAYIVFTSFHLLFWMTRRISIRAFRKSSSIFLLTLIFIMFFYFLNLYLTNLPSTSFSYKLASFSSIFNVFTSNPFSLFFGFDQVNVHQFTQGISDNMSYGNNSYESWYLRLFIFGGITLPLIYLLPLFKVIKLSFRIPNYDMFYIMSALLASTLSAFVSNGGFGGLNSWVYFYLLSYIISLSTINTNKYITINKTKE